MRILGYLSLFASLYSFAQPTTPDVPVNYRACIESFDMAFTKSIGELQDYVDLNDQITAEASQDNQASESSFTDGGVEATKKQAAQLKEQLVKAVKAGSHTATASNFFDQSSAQADEAAVKAAQAIEGFNNSLEGHAGLNEYLNKCYDHLSRRESRLQNIDSDIDKVIALLAGIQTVQTALEFKVASSTITDAHLILAAKVYNGVTLLKSVGDFFGPIADLQKELSKDKEDSKKNERAAKALNLLKSVNAVHSGLLVAKLANMTFTQKSYIACLATSAGLGCEAFKLKFSKDSIAAKLKIAANIGSTVNAIVALEKAKSDTQKHQKEIEEFLTLYDPLASLSAEELAAIKDQADLGLGKSNQEKASSETNKEASTVAKSISTKNSDSLGQFTTQKPVSSTTASAAALAPQRAASSVPAKSQSSSFDGVAPVFSVFGY